MNEIHEPVREMLTLQDEMNSRVDANWRDLDREWWRAIWIECAELMDHYGGWKWWKHSERDARQVLLEIVDIWHFGLSARLVEAGGVEEAVDGIVADWQYAPAGGDFHRLVEQLAAAALTAQRFDVTPIPALLAAVGADFDDLYKHYVGKNVLNFFRQDHGYRDGRYMKEWQGREDNEHLAELIDAADPAAPALRDRLYRALTERYPGA